MKLRLFFLPALLVVGLTACQTLTTASHPQGLEKYGYPYVLKTVHFTPGTAMKVTVPDQATSGPPPGHATFSIPANAFTMPVTIQFLAAKNSSWDSKVSSDLKVIANFAYLITNTNSGAIVGKFNKPIMYTLNDPMVTKDSIYWATTAKNPPKLINANKASVIKGTMLRHGTPVSVVGWIITTPKSQISMGSSSSMSSSTMSSSSSGGY